MVEKRRRDRRIPRIALQDPSVSSWRKLYHSNNDQAMITLTGLDHCTFGWLLDMFCPCLSKVHSLHQNWRDQRAVWKARRSPTPYECCRLPWFEPCLDKTLWVHCCPAIDIWDDSYKCLNVLKVWEACTNIALEEPPRLGNLYSKHTQKSISQAAKASRHPSLDSVWCTMDGLKLYLEQAGNSVIQNQFYNGWTHDHYVSAVFVFCPDGTIPIGTWNVPGSFHDSTIAEWGNIYKKLRDVYENSGTAGKCTVDSAFSRKRYDFLIKSSQTDPDSDDHNDYVVNEEATSMRQSAEWGMRAFQSSFPRLKD